MLIEGYVQLVEITENEVDKRMRANRCPKVLLIVIYSRDMIRIYEEVGVSMIAAYLRKHEYEVEIIAQTENNVDYLYIQSLSPQVVGFTVYYNSRKEVGRVSKKVGEALPDALLCLGGYEATCNDNTLMNEMKHIDLCIRGEGELTFLDIVRSIENGSGLTGINGITLRDGKDIVRNQERELIPDLNHLPYMARDILVNNKLQIAQIWTSRGCMGHCTFCISQRFWKKWRGREIKYVIDEIEYVKNTYDIDTFYFIDGSIEDPDEDCSRLRALAQGIIDRNLNIYYMALFRADFVRKATPNLMELLTASGLYTAFVGVEAANEDDLRLFCKRGHFSDSIKVMELFKEYKIGLQVGFIMFHPYSNRENIIKNIEFLAANNYISRFNGYLLLEGTPLSKKVERDGLVSIDSRFGYNFEDSDIGRVLLFITEYLEQNANMKMACSVMDNVTNNILFTYQNILRRCERGGLKQYIKRLEQYYDQVMEMLKQINIVIGDALISLFQIPEDQWDEEIIITNLNAYQDEKQVKNIISRLQIIINKMYLEISSFSIPDFNDLKQLMI